MSSLSGPFFAFFTSSLLSSFQSCHFGCIVPHFVFFQSVFYIFDFLFNIGYLDSQFFSFLCPTDRTSSLIFSGASSFFIVLACSLLSDQVLPLLFLVLKMLFISCNLSSSVFFNLSFFSLRTCQFYNDDFLFSNNFGLRHSFFFLHIPFVLVFFQLILQFSDLILEIFNLVINHISWGFDSLNFCLCILDILFLLKLCILVFL